MTTEHDRALAVTRHLRAINASPVALAYLDGSGRVAFSNNAAIALFGDTAREGERLLLSAFDTLPRFETTSTSVLAKRTQSADHGVYLLSQQPVLTDEGLEERLVTAQPLSDPESVELINLRQMRMHKEVLDAMSEGVAILDGAGLYLYMNAAHARMYGYEASELIGRSWTTLYEESERRGLELTVFPMLASAGRWSSEVRGRLKDGSHSLFSVSLVIAGPYLVCCCQDVSEHIRQAERLRQTAQHLDDVNAELRSAVKLKDEFLATVSHELRSPMHAILGAMELLHEELPAEPPPALARHIDILTQSARHLHNLINDLLDVSSIVSNGIELTLSTIPASRVLATAVMLLSERADEKGVALSSRINGPNATIVVDERRLLQVVVNLLSNAIDFTPSGGRVHAQIDVVDNEFTLSVEDTGSGIPQDQLSAIFGKFHQVDRSLGRRHNGTGLGLFLVKELVSRHGGTVNVSSTMGNGSTFIVTIPQNGKQDARG